MNDNLDSNNNCKGCSASVRISPEEISALFNQTLRVKEIKLVTEEEYSDRIETCLACPALQYGTTCQYCGCLVHLKAKLRAAKCPFPYAPKWPMIEALETKQPKQR
jgi:hypothetical protein